MKKIYKKRIKELTCLLLCILSFSSCKKFLQLDAPETKISTQSAYKDDNSATAVLTGIYAQLTKNYINAVSLPATSFYEELSADNLVLFDVAGRSDLASYYQNNLEPGYAATGNVTYWTNIYTLLYTINTSIEALTNNTILTPAVSKRLLGEAYFLRGFNYFYLVNLYGDVPLILSSDYTINSKMGRTSATNVYTQINADLAKAETLLDYNYADLDVTKTTSERVRPNLSTVNALQARVNLYLKNYAAAEASATKVITQSGTYSFVPLNAVFLKNSKETIWALQPVDNGFNTGEGQLYTLPSTGPDYDRPAYASNSLVNSFELGDDRKNNWLGNITTDGNTYWYPSKYKVPYVALTDVIIPAKEYTIVMRLAEQYLIRAEARNEQGNITGAIDDLNALRVRSRAAATAEIPNPLPNLSASFSQDQIRTAVMQERRVELFTEWGHRWFDLKRLGANTIDPVMTKAEEYKGGTWVNYKSLYPIPVFDILRNPALTQNQGYTN